VDTRIFARSVEIDGDVDRGFASSCAGCGGSHGRPHSTYFSHARRLSPHDPLNAARSSPRPMNDDVRDSLIPYDEIVQDALRAVVGRVLSQIAVMTACPAASFLYHLQDAGRWRRHSRASDRRFPDEMTIVLQNKFWDLKVEDDHFSVGLSFNQTPSILTIPYAAITAFVDPSVNFGLQFQVSDDDEAQPEPHDEADNDRPEVTSEDGSNVVTVDFGKKNIMAPLAPQPLAILGPRGHGRPDRRLLVSVEGYTLFEEATARPDRRRAAALQPDQLPPRWSLMAAAWLRRRVGSGYWQLLLSDDRLSVLGRGCWCMSTRARQHGEIEVCRRLLGRAPNAVATIARSPHDRMPCPSSMRSPGSRARSAGESRARARCKASPMRSSSSSRCRDRGRL
jgi:hypothetical protein